MNRVLSVFSASAIAAGTFACASSSATNPEANTAESAPAETMASASDNTMNAMGIDGVGFDTPESVFYDSAADMYLVANIGGSPFGVDGKGFISRLTPDGKLETLRWIDGTQDGVTLNAPKGMAMIGDILYVTDVTAIRKFSRTTGEPMGGISVAGATFLNDLSAAADGTLYVSDTGWVLDGEGSEGGVYAIDSNEMVTKIDGAPVMPNGLLAMADGSLVMLGWKSGEVMIRKADGMVSTLTTLPKTQLDGVVQDKAGNFLVSSWEGECIYKIMQDGKFEIMSEGLSSPADIGFDDKRAKVLVPRFKTPRVDVIGS